MPKIETPSVNTPNWVTIDPDTPPATPNALDDEFGEGSLNAKWTWLNQGTTSLSFANSRIIFTHTGPNTLDNYAGIHQPCPVGNWKFRLKQIQTGTSAAYYLSTIFIRDSSSGKIVAYGPGVSGSGTTTIVAYMTSPTAFGAVAVADDRMSTTGVFNQHYLEVEYDGTNFIFRASFDGVSYFTSATLAAGAHITNRSNIGIGHYVSQTTTTLIQHVDWFRRIS